MHIITFVTVYVLKKEISRVGTSDISSQRTRRQNPELTYLLCILAFLLVQSLYCRNGLDVRPKPDIWPKIRLEADFQSEYQTRKFYNSKHTDICEKLSGNCNYILT